jgi:hypothetical protein
LKQQALKPGTSKAPGLKGTPAWVLIDGGCGIDFLIRIVRSGDGYGQDNELVHDATMPLVEFYDARWPFNKAPDGSVLGQFIERHTLTNLARALRRKSGANPAGPGLDMSPYLAWRINPAGRRKVLDFLCAEA